MRQLAITRTKEAEPLGDPAILIKLIQNAASSRPIGTIT
jgi:hypothetical protein